MRKSLSYQHLLIALLLAAVILAIAELLVVTISVSLLLLAGILFGIFINGITRWVARKTPLNYRWSYFLVVALLLSSTGGIFYYLGAQLAERASDFWRELQAASDQAAERLEQYEWAKQYLPDAAAIQRTLLSGSAAVPEVLKGLRWFGWLLTAVIVVAFIGIYSALEPQVYRNGLISLVPPQRRDRAEEVLDVLQQTMARWIIGRLFSMAIVGVVTAIGLSLLGVPLPLTLGVIAGLLSFIPNMGPLLAAVPQILLALNVGTSTWVYVIVFNLALQCVESYLITPLIQRHEVSLPPAVTIFVQIWMTVVAGIIGVMMAAPLAVATMVLIQMLYIEDRLGDHHFSNNKPDDG